MCDGRTICVGEVQRIGKDAGVRPSLYGQIQSLNEGKQRPDEQVSVIVMPKKLIYQYSF